MAALDHPRRRALYGYVAAHPGGAIREATRATGIPNGTAIHHLGRLLRDRILVCRRHGHSHRLFPASQATAEDQLMTIVLREPQVSAVYEWVKAHPQTSQKTILDAMAALHAMPRSTTQHRLARLLRHGLVAARPVGARTLAYLAFEVS